MHSLYMIHLETKDFQKKSVLGEFSSKQSFLKKPNYPNLAENLITRAPTRAESIDPLIIPNLVKST